MTRLWAGVLVCSLLAAHIYLYPRVYRDKAVLDQRVEVNYVLPASFTRVAALDFKGLAADYQFLQANFFVGEKIERHRKITLENWAYFKRIINAVTDLDPYFFDPYYFAGGMLAWGPHLYEDAIEILKKGMIHRPRDRRLPFMIGFYYFYFLNDPQKGAEYITLAAKTPGAPSLYATLASRLSYYAGEHESSILILKEMLSNTRDERIRSKYLKRLQALEGAISLEQAVKRYKQQYGLLPASIQTLILTGIISEVPVDPYGGEFVLTDSGRVFSTSKFAEKTNSSLSD